MRFIVVFIFVLFSNLLFCDFLIQLDHSPASSELLVETLELEPTDFVDESDIPPMKHIFSDVMKCRLDMLELKAYTDVLSPLYLTPPRT